VDKLQREQRLQATIMLSRFFKDDLKKVDLWMRMDNPLLGNVSPMHMILIGRGHKLLNFMKTMLEENERP
jgi:hypothetical protein